MCGIAGIWSFSVGHRSELINQAQLMSSAITRRGPDDTGVWCDHEVGLALAHRRLSILDLSPAGHQPMCSATARYVIVFNGEIYNHLSLRHELEGSGLLNQQWRGHSDTETFLAAVEAWGVKASLQRCVGMFALALWDRRDRCLHLIRDRFGEKPLYWGLSGTVDDQALLFGSELSALRAWPGFNNDVHRPAVAQFFRFGSLSAPSCIYSGIQQLLPGHLVTIQNPLTHRLPEPQPWWCFRSLVSKSVAEPFTDPSSGLDALESALRLSVHQQSLADVPLGSFLSGGVDSSLITTLLQAQSSSPVRTFTIGFEENGFNEAPFASAVADHLGTDHTEITLTSADAQSLIPQLPLLYSEPFADSSQLPTHLVCREARRSGLKVAICGDGGDELFGGYNRYFWGPRIWNRLAWLPWSFRYLLGFLVRSLPPAGWDLLSHSFPVSQLGHKAHKLAHRLQHVRCSDDLYRSLVSEWVNPSSLLQPYDDGSSVEESGSPLDWPLPSSLSIDDVARMMVIDTLNYLPNDILTKVDRASMSASLETRAPFLDHRVAEVAWRLPMNMKIDAGKGASIGKSCLRQILYKYVPPHLIERPKSGFAIPIGQWLRGPLRSWAEDLLDPCIMQRQGYLQSQPVSKLWREHLSGRYDHTGKLWSLLMWQAWLSEWE